MKTTFDSSKYEMSHGKAPRGVGSWAFCPRDKFDASNYLDFTKWMPTSTFKEAKRQAVIAFPNGSELVVCP